MFGNSQRNPYGQVYTQQPYQDTEDHFGEDEVKLSRELDIVIRHGFIRKVFTIVGAQLVLTALIALPFSIYHATLIQPAYSAAVGSVVLLTSIVTMCLMCYMSCNPEVGRQYPKNYLILAGITAGMGCMVGIGTMHYTGASILLCVGMTAAICIGLMGFAMQTKWDFTSAGPYLFAALMALSLFGFVLIFVGGALAQKFYAGCGAILFSFYLIYDTQLIVGGNNKKHQFGIDDYVFAALTLYLDIINLFLYLLELFGDRR